MWDDIGKALLAILVAYVVAWLQGATRRRLLRQEIVGDFELIEKLDGAEPHTARVKWRLQNALDKYAPDPRAKRHGRRLLFAAVFVLSASVALVPAILGAWGDDSPWWAVGVAGVVLGLALNLGLDEADRRHRRSTATYVEQGPQ